MTIPAPTPYETPIPPPATGSRLARGLRQLAKGQLPGPLEGPVDKALARVGLKTKVVTADGLKIRIRRNAVDERFIYNIIELQEYNPPGYEIQPTDTVIDVGGNLGTFALYAGKRAQRVLTFEPISENVELLRQNIAMNRLTNVEAFHAAVAGTKREIRIYKAPPEHSGSHSMVLNEMYGTQISEFEAPPVTTLPDVFRNQHVARCHLLKLDCEGAEFEILEQLPADIYARIDRIVMEYHARSLNLAEKRAMVDPLVARLQAQGFTIDAYLHNVGFRSGFIRAAKR